LFGSSGESATPLTPGKAATEGLFGKIGKGIGGLFGNSSVDPFPNARIEIGRITVVQVVDEPPPSIDADNARSVEKLKTVAQSVDLAREYAVRAIIFPVAPVAVTEDVFESIAGVPIIVFNPKNLIKKVGKELLEEGAVDAGRQVVKESHHLLPKAKNLKPFFERAGLNIEDFKIILDKAKHRLKVGNGVHTGKRNWNKVWKEFFDKEPNREKEEILQKLDEMRKEFGI
jgi:hypothetical protein